MSSAEEIAQGMLAGAAGAKESIRKLLLEAYGSGTDEFLSAYAEACKGVNEQTATAIKHLVDIEGLTEETKAAVLGLSSDQPLDEAPGTIQEG